MARARNLVVSAASVARSGSGEPELDEITLRRAQKGNEVACRALVERYQRPVFALVGRMLGSTDRPAVEDVAQETFLHVFRSLSGFSPLGRARLSTWILTIASRRAVDHLRRRAPASEGIDAVADRLPTGSRPDESANRANLARAIERAMLSLSPDKRACVLLRDVHGFEYAEIARALSLDLGTVKSRLSRARQQLREALEEVHE